MTAEDMAEFAKVNINPITEQLKKEWAESTKMNVNPITEQLKREWAEFAKTEDTREPGDLVYPDIFENGWLYPLQRTRETALMMHMAQSLRPRVVMEIGSDKGGGFYHWIKGLPTVEKAVAIEYSGVPFADAFRAMFPRVDFKFIHGSSYAPETVVDVRRFLVEHLTLFDCIFIDGDKGGTLRDFDSYVSMVRPGGLVFIHDVEASVYNGVVPNPSTVFYDLRKRYPITAIIDGTEAIEAAEREKQGIPVADSYELWLRTWKWNSCGVGVVHI